MSASRSYSQDDSSPWSSPAIPQQSEPTVASALEKEHVLKDIIQLRDGLRGLMVRITEVEGETEKLKKDNEMLGIYIDNLTRNSVVAAGNKR